jgi:diguanylate cyclase (GGDEF)-like protein
VALLDLDHFKAFNDEFGHVAGDELLKAGAHNWENSIRGLDAIGRYGGEEFIAILPNCSTDVAMGVADRLRISTPFGQTCSVGVAMWDGRESVAALIERADSALYRAKTDGRNRVVLDGNLEVVADRERRAA